MIIIYAWPVSATEVAHGRSENEGSTLRRDAYMDVGARATQDAVAERDRERASKSCWHVPAHFAASPAMRKAYYGDICGHVVCWDTSSGARW